MLPITIATGILTLTACNGGGSDVIVESEVGNITKDEFYTEMKDMAGEPVLQSMLYEKVLADKYEVSDKELDEKVKEFQEQYGETFYQQSGFESEDAFKEDYLKLNLLLEKAVASNITDEDVKKSILIITSIEDLIKPIEEYFKAGFTKVYLHSTSPNEIDFIQKFSKILSYFVWFFFLFSFLIVRLKYLRLSSIPNVRNRRIYFPQLEGGTSSSYYPGLTAPGA